MPKFCREKFFLHLWGDLKIYGRVIFVTTLSLFHFFRNIQPLETWSVYFKNFFRKRECINCYMSISSNLLKRSFRKNFTFCAYCDRWYRKKYSISCIFQTIVVIVKTKILEKYLWISSARILITNSRTPFLKVSSTSCVCSL